jgi:hypothetical protein
LIYCFNIDLFLKLILNIEKEAIALVKDAIEFCDNIPIVYEDQRTRDKQPIKSNTSVEKNNNNYKSPIQTTEIQPNIMVEAPITNLNSEYIPQFTELQRKQLDEQLRNVSKSLNKRFNYFISYKCYYLACTNAYSNMYSLL